MRSNAFVRSMRVLAACVVVGFSCTPAALCAAFPKKGVGEYAQPDGAKTLSELKVSWYYDWQPTPDVTGAPAGVQIVPMIGGDKNLNAADLHLAKASGADTMRRRLEVLHDDGGECVQVDGDCGCDCRIGWLRRK